ncbi:GntR family transcriptional regulator [Loktanella agnita]|uniref:GntR family transcriptional regulator n=1 Tax=Loktanella agnita TaxID=287097 RepID=UPI00398A133C
MTFEPLEQQTVSATDLVFRMVYDAVISLRLPPGTKVSETEIARQLDVSRQPVRDAFFRLSNLGFLSIRPQRATLITRISEEAVLNAVFTRIALEVECLRSTIQRLTDSDIAALRAHLALQKKALNQTDATAFHQLDDKFHGLLCEISGHAHAWNLIQEHKAHMDRIRYLTLSAERQSEVLEEHTSLVESIAARNLAQAETYLRAHLGAIRGVLEEIRDMYPDYFEPTS